MKKKVVREILYCYISPQNSKYARGEGKKMFGRVSYYIDALISKDRGVKPKLISSALVARKTTHTTASR